MALNDVIDWRSALIASPLIAIATVAPPTIGVILGFSLTGGMGLDTWKNTELVGLILLGLMITGVIMTMKILVAIGRQLGQVVIARTGRTNPARQRLTGIVATAISLLWLLVVIAVVLGYKSMPLEVYITATIAALLAALPVSITASQIQAGSATRTRYK